MKAELFMKTKGYVVNLDKEAIKAIRFCYGLNPDLRTGVYVNRNHLWDWIDSNFIRIIGYYFEKPLPTNPNWKSYEDCVWNMVYQVLNGKCN